MRLLFDSYLQAIQYYNLNKIQIENIYLKNYTFIKYNKPFYENLYIIQEFEPELSDIFFEAKKNTQTNDCVIIDDFKSDDLKVDNLKDLIYLIKNAKHIACDDEYTSLVSCILDIKYKETHFLDTQEGNFWQLIYAFKYPFETIILKKLEIFQEEKIANHPYPFMEYSPYSTNVLFLKYKKLIHEKKYKELYEIFSKKPSILIEENFIDKIQCVSYESNKLIDKNLSQFYQNVIYIGKDNIKCEKKINYLIENNNKIFKFPDIQSKKEFLTNNEQELNLLNLKKFGKLKQKQLNIIEKNNDIYCEILKECKRSIQDLKNIKWQQDLYYSGIEFRKILIKAKLIIEKYNEIIKNFENIQIKYNHEAFSFRYDFYFTHQNKDYYIDLYWNLPSKQDIYTNLKYKKPGVIFYLVSTESYTIDQNNFDKYEINATSEYNDLFYWYNTCLTA